MVYTDDPIKSGDALTNFELITPTQIRRDEPQTLLRKELRTGYLDEFDRARFELLAKQYHLAKMLDWRMSYGEVLVFPRIADRKAEEIMEFISATCSKDGFTSKLVKTQFHESSSPIPGVMETEDEEYRKSKSKEFFTSMRKRFKKNAFY